jgi:galactokinase
MPTAPPTGSESLPVVWAPGRLNLIGEHTDYSGGLVLPAAIQLGVTLRVSAAAGDVRLDSPRFGPGESFGADGGGPPAAGWARYGQGVAAELAALGRPPVGLVGRVDSDLPPGAGLSSSAALEVAIALALCAVAGFELEPLELALACQRAELRAVGVPCGILDQAASVLGRENEALLLDCGTLDYRYVRVPERAALVIVDSGIAHSHESSGYADRRRELEEGMPSRVRHVETENQRVLDFAAALEADDLETAGRLLVASHASLRDDYEVSLPAIDALVERALAAGALGARIVGGGFGGSVLALTETSRADELAAALETSLIARASAGASVRA